MGFQNENQLKVGALVKATINDKVVEAKVISIGFNRVTLRSEKGNEVSYAFNSEKFLKWFNQVPLNEVSNAENSKGDDILKGIKIVTSGPSVKERTTEVKSKEKEDRFKLAFGFKDSGMSSFEIVAEDYTLSERKSRLGILMSPMFFDGKGSSATAIIVTALAFAKNLNRHTDAEWRSFIDNRDLSLANVESLDHLDRVGITLFCNVIREYAMGGEYEAEVRDLSPSGLWAEIMPKNKNEALFIAQLLCDGGINKYGLSCAGLTENLLKDIELTFGLATPSEIDEYLANLEKEGEIK
ncbi:hypothetical protein BIZ47_07275 [Helicobacter pylori]|uniref:hypothetical protein n=1 Tax=Helicobacter pylori TaxID=210 RepID=UPI000952870C|nr:hypothetical protein [Helicobacter pylori]OLR52727.1 hypothetical protein BIZ49_07440 [Helicobacter pylori]OLR53521.1 hypothetical protein BIZ47_07275 [Helicobacter pylori]